MCPDNKNGYWLTWLSEVKLLMTKENEVSQIFIRLIKINSWINWFSRIFYDGCINMMFWINFRHSIKFISKELIIIKDIMYRNTCTKLLITFRSNV